MFFESGLTADIALVASLLILSVALSQTLRRRDQSLRLRDRGLYYVTAGGVALSATLRLMDIYSVKQDVSITVLSIGLMLGLASLIASYALVRFGAAAGRALETTARRTAELKDAYDIATEHGGVIVFIQDRALEYRWINRGRLGLKADEIIGKTDDEILPESVRERLVNNKRRVLDTGVPASLQIEMTENGELVSYQVDIAPYREDGEGVSEIVCTATDVTRLKSLDDLREKMAKRILEEKQRMDLALKAGSIFVFAQNCDHVYTWSSADITPFGAVINKTDAEIFDPKTADMLRTAKLEAEVAMEPRHLEFGQTRNGETQWFDLSIEPIIAPDGSVPGVISAAVEVTERRQAAAQKTLLLRELTHRSKNLLTIIQSIARQTARRATTTAGFVDSFSERLRAIALTQDLLVADDWGGSALDELCRQQIGPWIRGGGMSRVRIEGPQTILTPEATQALGLALHELATNAAKYGALSNETGVVSISWQLVPDTAGTRLEIDWIETGGPPVSPPEERGFGVVVVEQNVAASLDAIATVKFAHEGVKAHFDAPLYKISVHKSDDIGDVPPVA